MTVNQDCGAHEEIGEWGVDTSSVAHLATNEAMQAGTNQTFEPVGPMPKSLNALSSPRAFGKLHLDSN